MRQGVDVVLNRAPRTGLKLLAFRDGSSRLASRASGGAQAGALPFQRNLSFAVSLELLCGTQKNRDLLGTLSACSQPASCHCKPIPPRRGGRISVDLGSMTHRQTASSHIPQTGKSLVTLPLG